jgi:transcriptional regulator with XRE-family HTH domain
MEKVYINLKMMRVKSKFSMAEMAEKLDINQSSYFQLEKGETKLTIERLYEIASIFKVSVLDLLGEESKSPDNPEVEKLKKEIADLKFNMRDLEDYNRLLKNEVEEYESLIFDNNMEISGEKLFVSVFIIGEFQNLMELFLEKNKDGENGYTDYTASRINEKFNQLISSDEMLPLVNLIYNNNKLLKSAITQEDGRIDVALFRKEYNELLKNYRDESKT